MPPPTPTDAVRKLTSHASRMEVRRRTHAVMRYCSNITKEVARITSALRPVSPPPPPIRTPRMKHSGTQRGAKENSSRDRGKVKKEKKTDDKEKKHKKNKKEGSKSTKDQKVPKKRKRRSGT